ncbi:hypothetical protein FB446DRAFT_479495 [Lentinula raphanica]|nr:hypothetical protein FB446DRAFT_479495 [Lentinula raphanica]
MDAFNHPQPSAGHVAIDMSGVGPRSSSRSPSNARAVHQSSRTYPYLRSQRPIQRSLFADERPPNPFPDAPLVDPWADQVCPLPMLHEATNYKYLPRTYRAYPRPGPYLVSTSKETQTRLGTTPTSPTIRPNVQQQQQQQTQPLTSPLRSFFDSTVQNFYTGLTHLQSAWTSALYREKKEKEIITAQFLKMQRERDVAMERARILEEQSSSTSDSITRSSPETTDNEQRPVDSEGNSQKYPWNADIQLPTPPATGTFLPLNSPDRQSSSGSPVADYESYSLVYPSEYSTSPSPPPPQISGRQIFRPIVLHSSSSDVSQSPKATKMPRLLSPREGRRIRLPLSSTYHGSGRNSVRSSSSSKSQRRSSADSLSSCGSFSTAYEECVGESSRSVSKEALDVPETKLSPVDSNDGLGECDMDISETEAEASDEEPDASTNKDTNEDISGQSRSGKKLLFHDQEDEVVRVPVASLEQEQNTVHSVQSPVTPTIQQQDSSSELKIPRLHLQDLNRMYFSYDGVIYCRVCCSRKPDTRWRCSSPLPLMDARRLDLDVLMNHCTSQHPVAYSDVAGLTLDQVFRLQKLLKANVPSAP